MTKGKRNSILLLKHGNTTVFEEINQGSALAVRDRKQTLKRQKIVKTVIRKSKIGTRLTTVY